MPNPNRRVTCLLTATVFVAVSTACANAGPRTDGPLSLGTGNGAVCMLPGPTSDYTFGSETLRNNGHRPAEITGVTMVSARDISMPEAYVAPIINHTLVGNALSWPPRTPESEAVWEEKVPAAKATVAAGSDNTSNLVVHLHVDGPSARFDAIQIEYTSAGTRYVARTKNAVMIKAPC